MRNLIKKKMIDLGRDDFVNCLAELLNISRQSASNKLNGASKFDENELRTLKEKLNMTAEELLQVEE